MSAQDEANAAALAFACNSASQLALLANPDATELVINGVLGPAVVPPYVSPPGTKIFWNGPQTCSVTCPDSSLFTFTCPPGRFMGANQAQADAIARSYACQQAFLRRVCLPSHPCSITDTTPLPAFDQGQPYSHQFTASGGVPPFAWSITAGTLPAGLSMNANGLISGTASLVNGNLDQTFTVRATDFSTPPNTCSKEFTLPVLDYHDFPPGKKWRLSGYADGVLNAGCCPAGVTFVWAGNFPNKISSAFFQADGATGITSHPTQAFLLIAPSGEWAIRIYCILNPTEAVWIGTKAGSNTGVKLDSPAGPYSLNNYFGYAGVCDATPTLTIEEY